MKDTCIRWYVSNDLFPGPMCVCHSLKLKKKNKRLTLQCYKTCSINNVLIINIQCINPDKSITLLILDFNIAPGAFVLSKIMFVVFITGLYSYLSSIEILLVVVNFLIRISRFILHSFVSLDAFKWSSVLLISLSVVSV